ncbi:hypothetical protein D3C80_1605240 [compost metagenome]
MRIDIAQRWNVAGGIETRIIDIEADLHFAFAQHQRAAGAAHPSLRDEDRD